MIDRCKVAARRAAGIYLLALIMLAFAMPPASSQGVFETLSGIFARPAPPALPPQVMPYAPPLALAAPASAPAIESRFSRDVGGPFVAYCVRLCDGSFFPLARSFAISPADQCRSFCPAAKTKIFGGSNINHAAAADGSRYANLATAHLYRTRTVENCTCNGKDTLGAARVDITADPTLRAGDIVAIDGGFAVYKGARFGAKQASDFTPIGQYAGLPADTRRKLAQTKVLPARQTAAQMPPTVSAEKKPILRDERRAQLLR